MTTGEPAVAMRSGRKRRSSSRRVNACALRSISPLFVATLGSFRKSNSSSRICFSCCSRQARTRLTGSSGAAAPNALAIVTRPSNHLSFIAVHHLRAAGPRPTFIPLAPGPHRLHPNAAAALGTPRRRMPQARLPDRRLSPRPTRPLRARLGRPLVPEILDLKLLHVPVVFLERAGELVRAVVAADEIEKVAVRRM